VNKLKTAITCLVGVRDPPSPSCFSDKRRGRSLVEDCWRIRARTWL